MQTLKESQCATMGVDRATNALSKSISNVIFHTKLPLFIEYLRSDFRWETMENVVIKLKDTVNLIETLIGHNPDCFVTNRCNGRRDVRRKILEGGVLHCVYGCVRHCLNNFCEDLSNLFWNDLMKKALFVSKTIRSKNLLRKLFEKLYYVRKKRPGVCAHPLLKDTLVVT